MQSHCLFLNVACAKLFWIINDIFCFFSCVYLSQFSFTLYVFLASYICYLKFIHIFLIFNIFVRLAIS